MLLGTPTHLRKRAKLDEKPANWVATSVTRSLSLQGKRKRDSLKVKEQSGNVYEN
jgi:hypothetical protein